jgi:hypothetical protein
VNSFTPVSPQPVTSTRKSDFYIDGVSGEVPKFKVARRRGWHVARMYTVKATAGELYCLRLLLVHKVARSYNDLKTVGGVVCATFREAAEREGLLTTLAEYGRAMEDAVTRDLATPSMLRQLFVVIVSNGDDQVPVKDLYERFRVKMALDVCADGTFNGRARNGLVPHDTEDDAALDPRAELYLLRGLAKSFDNNAGKSLADVGLPPVEDFVEAHPDVVFVPDPANAIVDERDRAHAQFPPAAELAAWNQMHAQANAEQRVVLDAIALSLDFQRECEVALAAGNEAPPTPAGMQHCFHIEARAGRGKTFVEIAAAHKARSLGASWCCAH